MEHIVFYVLESLPYVIAMFIVLCLYRCHEEKQEDSDSDANSSGVATAPRLAARVTPMAAPAAEQGPPAPVVSLPYFPYSQQGSRRESEKLVCPICLELLLQGAMCSEVPACRHLFHGECIAVWMKNSSTCPMCRVQIASGSSVEVSAADDMV